jgi:hypothetical protein
MQGEAPERVANAGRIDANARRSPRACANAGIQSAAPERVANAGANEKPMRGEAPELVANVGIE